MQVTVYNIVISGGSYYNYDDYVKAHKRLAPVAEIIGATVLPILPKPEEEDKYAHYTIFEGNSFVVNKETLLELTIANATFEVKGQVKVAVNIQEAFEEVENRQVNIMEGTSTVYNNKCDVHMPGNMLAMYNDVLLLEDSCSDALQSALVQGWRIIAACPQPDKRRPDYILGRWNPDKDNREDSAARQA